MREIKFKAVWNNKVYQPYEIEEISWSGNILHFKIKGYANVLSHSEGNQRLLEFTGLKDKNGKEIYEGDIVKYLNGSIKTIEWYENGFYLSGVSHTQFSGDEVEVMGNSHEKPEQPEEHVNP